MILKNFEGQFQLPPQHIDKFWTEDRIIPLPIRLDLQEAQSLCDQRGCGGHPDSITLRWALAPEASEPQYIFTMLSKGSRCFVGVNTRTVHCEPIGD